jgi:phage terminase large subunit GpA-like protein
MPTDEQKRIWRKNFYQKHKEHVKEYNGTKVQCEICGCTIQRSYLRTHQKTKKCLKVNQNIQSNQVETEPKQSEPEPKQTSKPRTFELKLDNEDENSKVFTILIKC